MSCKIIKVRKTHCKGNRHGGRASLINISVRFDKYGTILYY